MGKTAPLPSRGSLFGGPKKPTQPLRSLPPAPATVPEPVPPPAPAAPTASAPPVEAQAPLPPPPPVVPAPAPTPRVAREKFTFMFGSQTLEDLDTVWIALRQKTGKKIRKSWIVEAALRSLIRDPDQALKVLLEEMTQARP